MEEIFRGYKQSDYEQCEELVNQAWGFDKIFSTKELSGFAKLVYAKGSVLGSNYKMVVEDEGQFVGFIFGLGLLWKLIWIKGNKLEKKNLLDALNSHQKNRVGVVDRGRSEIVLFVISKEYQGKGVGKKLWSGFKNSCIESGVRSVVVETNKLGASSFYERIGFQHLANFNSPLHELATKGGQACMYEYKCK